MTRALPGTDHPNLLDRVHARPERRRVAAVTVAAMLVPLVGGVSAGVFDPDRLAPTGVQETDVVAPPADELAVQGEARVGEKLSIDPARALWRPPDAELTFQWFAADEAVDGADGPSLALTPALLGDELRVKVTGTAPGGGSLEEAPSDSVDVVVGTVEPGTFAAPDPTITGTVQVGSTLTARPGTWEPSAALAYRWLRSGDPVPGATAGTYELTPSDLGETITVEVTGTADGYTTATRTSAPTAAVAAGTPSEDTASSPRSDDTTTSSGTFAAATPKIGGQVRAGATVSVSRGTWTPAASSYGYQWRLDGAAIRGATGSKFTIPSTYVGKKLSVTVTGARTGYTKKSVTSAATTVLRSYSRTTAPTVSGTARIGSVLRLASRGTWTPTPSSWTYQWKANGVSIPGATGSAFRLTSAEYGKKITLRITAVRSGYYRTPRTSAATAAVGAPSAVLTKDGTYRVGTSIAPGTYVASGTADGCLWERRADSGSSPSGIITDGVGYGQVIVTIQSTDAYFYTQGCGSWRKYYAYGAVRTSTAVDGVYRVGTQGGQLTPGVYEATGSPFGACEVVRLADFRWAASSVVDFQVVQAFPARIKLYPGDVGIETIGCSWKLVTG